MNYDFKEFLELCNNCRTKSDFLRRISDEESFVSQINDPDYLTRQLYLRRLNNARFCTEHGVTKEDDTFNNLLYELVERLK